MAIVNEHLKSNDNTIILTVPANKSYAITNIMVCNNGSTGAATFDMHFAPQGDPISNDDTRVINNLSMPAGETFTFDSERIVLETGDRLVFQSDPAFVFPTVNATTMVNGKKYVIVATGTTDFTTNGSADSNPGTVFTMANSPATGSGTVKLSGYSNLAATVSYLEV